MQLLVKSITRSFIIFQALLSLKKSSDKSSGYIFNYKFICPKCIYTTFNAKYNI